MRINIKRIALLQEKLSSIGKGFAISLRGGIHDPAGRCFSVLSYVDHIIL